jgi:hypothetical protein
VVVLPVCCLKGRVGRLLVFQHEIVGILDGYIDLWAGISACWGHPPPLFLLQSHIDV